MYEQGTGTEGELPAVKRTCTRCGRPIGQNNRYGMGRICRARKREEDFRSKQQELVLDGATKGPWWKFWGRK